MNIFRINTLDRANCNDKEVKMCASKEAVMRYLRLLNTTDAVITGEHDNVIVTADDIFDLTTIRVVIPSYTNDLLGIVFPEETKYYIIHEVSVFE